MELKLSVKQLTFLTLLLIFASMPLLAQTSISSHKSETTEKADASGRTFRRTRVRGHVKTAFPRNPYLERSMRERRRLEEDMRKPQYTDKMYFGHKRPPQKRSLRRRRLCRECAIVH